MIIPSIGWRLQLWYGLLLVAVLGGFGLVAYQLYRGDKFRRVDDELRQRMDGFTMVFNPGGPRGGRGGRGPNDFSMDRPGQPPPRRGPGPRDGGPREGGPFRNGPTSEGPMPDGPPPEGPGAFGPPGPEFRPGLRTPEQVIADSAVEGFYYMLLSLDGQRVSSSSNAPAETPALTADDRRPLPNRGGPRGGPPGPLTARTLGTYRFVTRPIPSS